MTQLQFTKEDRPPRPVLLNTDHIGAVEPRRKLLPNQASQGVDLINVFAGTKITMAWGEWFNVLEPYDEVYAQVYGAPSQEAEDLVAGNAADTPQDAAPASPHEVLEPTSALPSDAPTGGAQVEAPLEDVSSTKVGVDDAAQEPEPDQQESRPVAKKAPAKIAAKVSGPKIAEPEAVT